MFLLLRTAGEYSLLFSRQILFANFINIRRMSLSIGKWGVPLEKSL